MTSSIRDFWLALTEAVHPLDAPVFAAHPEHTFDLRFPPPAYIGDVDNAPIIILMGNGGFNPVGTPREFPDRAAVDEYIAFLHDPGRGFPARLSRYYRARRVGPWLDRSQAAIVNAVAYRSKRLSEEPYNRDVAKRLPSLAAHRKWLRDEVLP